MQRAAPYFQPKTIMSPPAFGEASLLASVARESSGSGEESPSQLIVWRRLSQHPICICVIHAELPSTPTII